MNTKEQDENYSTNENQAEEISEIYERQSRRYSKNLDQSGDETNWVIILCGLAAFHCHIIRAISKFKRGKVFSQSGSFPE